MQEDVDDVLDRGYSPPERLQGSLAHGVTPEEQGRAETIEERIHQEVPDPASAYGAPDNESGLDVDRIGGDDPDSIDAEDDWLGDGEVGDARAGRLVAPDGGLGEDVEKDLVGEDVGIDGAGASAEEAAVHVIEDPSTRTSTPSERCGRCAPAVRHGPAQGPPAPALHRLDAGRDGPRPGGAARHPAAGVADDRLAAALRHDGRAGVVPLPAPLRRGACVRARGGGHAPHRARGGAGRRGRGVALAGDPGRPDVVRAVRGRHHAGPGDRARRGAGGLGGARGGGRWGWSSRRAGCGIPSRRARWPASPPATPGEGAGTVVGFGLSNDERRGETEEFAAAFRIARRGGLALVPHAGELLGADGGGDDAGRGRAGAAGARGALGGGSAGARPGGGAGGGPGGVPAVERGSRRVRLGARTCRCGPWWRRARRWRWGPTTP